ncbi:hypothetical protein HDU93_001288 [Gonapodya sp. JEL0774]|nr:hypothetical protein HDU93_001288 [Gonapodya sp. JEL0774]
MQETRNAGTVGMSSLYKSGNVGGAGTVRTSHRLPSPALSGSESRGDSDQADDEDPESGEDARWDDAMEAETAGSGRRGGVGVGVGVGTGTGTGVAGTGTGTGTGHAQRTPADAASHAQQLAARTAQSRVSLPTAPTDADSAQLNLQNHSPATPTPSHSPSVTPPLSALASPPSSPRIRAFSAPAPRSPAPSLFPAHQPANPLPIPSPPSPLPLSSSSLNRRVRSVSATSALAPLPLPSFSLASFSPPSHSSSLASSPAPSPPQTLVYALISSSRRPQLPSPASAAASRVLSFSPDAPATATAASVASSSSPARSIRSVRSIDSTPPRDRDRDRDMRTASAEPPVGPTTTEFDFAQGAASAFTGGVAAESPPSKYPDEGKGGGDHGRNELEYEYEYGHGRARGRGRGTVSDPSESAHPPQPRSSNPPTDPPPPSSTSNSTTPTSSSPPSSSSFHQFSHPSAYTSYSPGVPRWPGSPPQYVSALPRNSPPPPPPTTPPCHSSPPRGGHTTPATPVGTGATGTRKPHPQPRTISPTPSRSRSPTSSIDEEAPYPLFSMSAAHDPFASSASSAPLAFPTPHTRTPTFPPHPVLIVPHPSSNSTTTTTSTPPLAPPTIPPPHSPTTTSRSVPLHHPSPTRHHHRSTSATATAVSAVAGSASASASAASAGAPAWVGGATNVPVTVRLVVDSDEEDGVGGGPQAGKRAGAGADEKRERGGDGGEKGGDGNGEEDGDGDGDGEAEGDGGLFVAAGGRRSGTNAVSTSTSTSTGTATATGTPAGPGISSVPPPTLVLGAPPVSTSTSAPPTTTPSPSPPTPGSVSVSVVYRDDSASRDMFAPEMPAGRGRRSRSPGGPDWVGTGTAGGARVKHYGGMGMGNGQLHGSGTATTANGHAQGRENGTVPPPATSPSQGAGAAVGVGGMKRVQSVSVLPSATAVGEDGSLYGAGDSRRRESRPLAPLVPVAYPGLPVPTPARAPSLSPSRRQPHEVAPSVVSLEHTRPHSSPELLSDEPPSSLTLPLPHTSASTPASPALGHRSSAPVSLPSPGLGLSLGLRRSPSSPSSPRFNPPVLPPPGTPTTNPRGRRGPRMLSLSSVDGGSPGSSNGYGYGYYDEEGFGGYASSVLDVVPRTKGGKLVRPVLRSGRKIGNASHAKKSVLFENQELGKVVLFEKSDIPNTIPTNPKYTMVDPELKSAMPGFKFDIVLKKGLEEGKDKAKAVAVNVSGGGGKGSKTPSSSSSSVAASYIAPPTESSAIFAHMVHLHSLKVVDDKIVSGEALVRNVAYEKQVGIRYTLDFWTSYTDLPCEYKTFHETIAGYDVFGFHLDLRELFFSVFERQHLSLSSTFAPSAHVSSPMARSMSGSNLSLIAPGGSPSGVTSSGGMWSYLATKGLTKALRESVGKQQKLTLSFAVYYKSAGGEWWDNNGGEGNNYEVELIRTPTPQTLAYLTNLPSNPPPFVIADAKGPASTSRLATSDGPPTFITSSGGSSSTSPIGTTALGLHFKTGRTALQPAFTFPPAVQQSKQPYLNHMPPTISPLWINPNAVAAAVAASAGGNVSVPPPPPMPKWGSWASDDVESGEDASGWEYADEDVSESGMSDYTVRRSVHVDRVGVAGGIPGTQFVVFDDGDAGAGKSPKQYVYTSIFLDAGNEYGAADGDKDSDGDPTHASYEESSLDHVLSGESSEVSTVSSTTPHSTPENSPVRSLMSEGHSRPSSQTRMPTKWVSQTMAARRFSPERGLPPGGLGGDPLNNGGGGPIRIGRASSAPPPASFYDVFFPTPTSPVASRNKRVPQFIVVDGHRITSAFSDGSPTSPEADQPDPDISLGEQVPSPSNLSSGLASEGNHHGSNNIQASFNVVRLDSGAVMAPALERTASSKVGNVVRTESTLLLDQGREYESEPLHVAIRVGSPVRFGPSVQQLLAGPAYRDPSHNGDEVSRKQNRTKRPISARFLAISSFVLALGTLITAVLRRMQALEEPWPVVRNHTGRTQSARHYDGDLRTASVATGRRERGNLEALQTFQFLDNFHVEHHRIVANLLIPGHPLLLRALKRAFEDDPYLPNVFNSVGPKAVTESYKYLVKTGSEDEVIVVERGAFYPYPYDASWKVFEAEAEGKIGGEGKLARLARSSTSLHLYGHKTRHLSPHANSTLAAAWERFSVIADGNCTSLQNCGDDDSQHIRIGNARFSLVAPTHLALGAPFILVGGLRVISNEGFQSRNESEGLLKGQSLPHWTATLKAERGLFWLPPATLPAEVLANPDSQHILNFSHVADKVILESHSVAELNSRLGKVVYVLPEQDSDFAEGRDIISVTVRTLYGKSVSNATLKIPVYHVATLVTVIVKTVSRFDKVFSLVDSVHASYPGIKIIVADDGDSANGRREGWRKGKGSARSRMKSSNASKVEGNDTDLQRMHGFYYLPLNFDVGLSAGRNAMVDRVQTEYFLTLDDDFTLLPGGGLGTLLHALEGMHGVFDIAAGKIPNDEDNFGFDYSGTMEKLDDVVRLKHGSKGTHRGCDHVDFVPNVFLGRTRLFQQRLKWDEDLKLGEHEEFFLRAKEMNIGVLTCPGVGFVHGQVEHWKNRTGYDKMRNRVYEFWKVAVKKMGVAKLEVMGKVVMDVRLPAPPIALKLLSAHPFHIFTAANFGQGEDYRGGDVMTLYGLKPSATYTVWVRSGNGFIWEEVGIRAQVSTADEVSFMDHNLVSNPSFEEPTSRWDWRHSPISFSMLPPFTSIRSGCLSGEWCGHLAVPIDSTQYPTQELSVTRFWQGIDGSKIHNAAGDQLQVIEVSGYSRGDVMAARSGWSWLLTVRITWANDFKRLDSCSNVRNGLLFVGANSQQFAADYDPTNVGWHPAVVTLCVSPWARIDYLEVGGFLESPAGTSVWFDQFAVLAGKRAVRSTYKSGHFDIVESSSHFSLSRSIEPKRSAATIMAPVITPELAAHAFYRRQAAAAVVSAITPSDDDLRTIYIIVGMSVFILIVWNIPYLEYILYPFKVLTIGLHEFGHASATILTGGHVEGIELDPHLGGVTHTRGGISKISLPAGYIGSTFWGALMLFAGFDTTASKYVSIVVAAVMLLILLWARNWLARGIAVAFAAVIILLFIFLPVGLRYAMLWMGTMSALYSLYDIVDDLIKRRVNESDASQFARVCGCGIIGPKTWGVIWLVISFAFVAAAIIGAIVAFKPPDGLAIPFASVCGMVADVDPNPKDAADNSGGADGAFTSPLLPKRKAGGGGTAEAGALDSPSEDTADFTENTLWKLTFTSHVGHFQVSPDDFGAVTPAAAQLKPDCTGGAGWADAPEGADDASLEGVGLGGTFTLAKPAAAKSKVAAGVDVADDFEESSDDVMALLPLALGWNLDPKAPNTAVCDGIGMVGRGDGIDA